MAKAIARLMEHPTPKAEESPLAGRDGRDGARPSHFAKYRVRPQASAHKASAKCQLSFRRVTQARRFLVYFAPYMSQENEQKQEGNARARTRTKREVPKGANVSPSRSGWIALAVVAAAFLAMRFLGQASVDKTEDLSVNAGPA